MTAEQASGCRCLVAKCTGTVKKYTLIRLGRFMSLSICKAKHLTSDVLEISGKVQAELDRIRRSKDAMSDALVFQYGKAAAEFKTGDQHLL